MEGPAIQGAGQDYMVVSAPVPTTFHPKVWLVVGQDALVLLVGSGNLTQAGFVGNIEAFDAVYVSPDTPITSPLLSSIIAFIDGLKQMWRPEDAKHLLCVETLSRIADACKSLPQASPDLGGDAEVEFIRSFLPGPFISHWPAGADIDTLYAASPYFGGSLDGLNSLTERYPLADLNVFPAVHKDEATDVPLAKLSAKYREAKVASLRVPAHKDTAFAHLKLYGLTRGSDAWICTTSANCTSAALKGPNVEAGLLRKMSAEALREYFLPSNAVLPDGDIKYRDHDGRGAQLHLWASEHGDRIEIVVSEDTRQFLPLTDVVITIRHGSNLETVRQPSLFQDSRSAHLSRTAFPEWNQGNTRSICLEMSGQSPRNGLAKGRCFVENRMLLTADPIHRSAWKGALILLDEEGAPELADLAAIFTLARGAFDGPLAFSAEIIGSYQSRPADEQKEAPSVAIWPPQPDFKELQRQIGYTATGRLQLFHRVFQTFLENEATEPRSKPVSEVIDREDDELTAKEVARREEEDRRLESHIERVWSYAEEQYRQVEDRLRQLCPSKLNSPNVWPAAIFCFLSTLAIFRAAKKLAPNNEWTATPSFLCDDFIRLMLNERKQHPDFCCPRGFRYRSEKFPALADDLRQEFGLIAHHDLALVMLTLFTDQRLRSDLPLNKIAVERRFQQICGEAFDLSGSDIDTCRRIWRRYLQVSANKLTAEDFEVSLRQLMAQHTH